VTTGIEHVQSCEHEIDWFVSSIDRSHPNAVEPKRHHRALAWPLLTRRVYTAVRVRRPYSSTLVTDVFALALAASIAAQSFSFHLRDVCLQVDRGLGQWGYSIFVHERAVSHLRSWYAFTACVSTPFALYTPICYRRELNMRDVYATSTRLSVLDSVSARQHYERVCVNVESAAV
jgi:hypothetical protein